MLTCGAQRAEGKSGATPHCILSRSLPHLEGTLCPPPWGWQQQWRCPSPVCPSPSTQVYEEKQRRCEQELEGLRQRCAAQARQAAQAAQRGQQVLQLQVLQLQQEKKQLQEDFAQLLQERELLERRCASFQRERTELAPRLEETKWEVSCPTVLSESGGAGFGWESWPVPEPCHPHRCARSQGRSLC